MSPPGIFQALPHLPITLILWEKVHQVQGDKRHQTSVNFLPCQFTGIPVSLPKLLRPHVRLAATATLILRHFPGHLLSSSPYRGENMENLNVAFARFQKKLHIDLAEINLRASFPSIQGGRRNGELGVLRSIVGGASGRVYLCFTGSTPFLLCKILRVPRCLKHLSDPECPPYSPRMNSTHQTWSTACDTVVTPSFPKRGLLLALRTLLSHCLSFLFRVLSWFFSFPSNLQCLSPPSPGTLLHSCLSLPASWMRSSPIQTTRW